ncbi:MAG TPA: Rpn family recombination-promoting nuclease/putative transposase [Thermoanaerobaculia bacterium]|nr:Rpn family recombination-promoting nuclease/putative transposase [Thermoanaerobaculia bacterium]
MGQHDLSYRLFFAHRRMIQGLLREIVGERWVDRIDFDSGERVDTSFVSPKHENRESDVIWKFRRRDGGEPVYVYILLEFQSRPDPSMPVRLMGYESLFYQSLMAGQPAAVWRKLPLVIPVVVYNGREPWNVSTDLGSLIGDLDSSAEIYRPQLRYRLVDEAAYPREDLAALDNPVADLFRIEKSRDWREVHASVHRLRQSVPPTEASLRRAFETWLQKVILPRLGLSQEKVSAELTLEELDTMLAESIDRWNREIREEGREEGRQEGEVRMLLRQLSLKFGPLDLDTEERVRSADADRLLGWGERLLTAERLQDVFRD